MDDLVALSLVVDVDVVRCVEFALGIVIHVHVYAVGDRAACAHVELKVELRLKAPGTVGDGIKNVERCAPLVLVSLELALQPRLKLKAQVSVLSQQVGRCVSHIRRRVTGRSSDCTAVDQQRILS